MDASYLIPHLAVMLRPGVVWLDDVIRGHEWRSGLAATKECDSFLSIGTHGGLLQLSADYLAAIAIELSSLWAASAAQRNVPKYGH